ncbi:MAG: AzlD domain-containing protein [Eubacteriales bacterium]|nr:AzlD domain-containing protein [Eubacteriales bacterium]
MSTRIYVSLIVMSLTVYAIRLIPFLFLRKPIKNVWFRSFLYYVPYVTLAVMTFPAILTATGNLWAGAVALAFGLVCAWISGDLFAVAITCCVSAFVMGILL